MRRAVVVLALLALCLPAMAKDKWPDKWKVGFVSFQMERGILITGLSGHGLPLERLDCGQVVGSCLYAQPACTAMIIKKVKAKGKKARIEICANAVNAGATDAASAFGYGAACFTLTGDWQTAVAKTEHECRSILDKPLPVDVIPGGAKYHVRVAPS